MDLKAKIYEKGPDLVSGAVAGYFVVNGATPASKKSAVVQLVKALSKVFSMRKQA